MPAIIADIVQRRFVEPIQIEKRHFGVFIKVSFAQKVVLLQTVQLSLCPLMVLSFAIGVFAMLFYFNTANI